MSATRAAHILVVDDEPAIRATLSAVLVREGYDVTAAASPKEAFELLGDGRFHVVITDLMMAGAERGLDVVTAVRTQSSSSEIIVLTGFASTPSAIQALRDGAFHYLAKPCDLEELKLTVQRALDKQELEHVARGVERAEIARAEAVRARQRLSALFEQAPALIALCGGPRHTLEFANLAFANVFGRSGDLEMLLPGQGGLLVLQLLDQVRRTGQHVVGHEIPIRHPTKPREAQPLYFNFVLQPTSDEESRKDGIFIHAVDVTEQVRGRERITQLADVLAEQALHDSLTGLPNRRLLLDRLEQAVKLAARHRRRLGLLFLDLDGFKDVNDTLGHAAGDVVLQHVGKAIQHSLRSSDTVGRWGGDEFAVLIPDLDAAPSAGAVARKLGASVSKPIDIDGHRVRVRASIGAAIYPDDGVDSEALMRKADRDMYARKTRSDRRRLRAEKRSA